MQLTTTEPQVLPKESHDRWFERTSRQTRRAMDRMAGRTDLIGIFETQIRAEHVLEHLHTCNDDHDGVEVAGRMSANDFDVLGVRRDGHATFGYVQRSELVEGPVNRVVRPFHAYDLVSDATAMVDVLRALEHRPWVFVVTGTVVGGLITRADLQKPPVRLLLFGLVTTLESDLLTGCGKSRV